MGDDGCFILWRGARNPGGVFRCKNGPDKRRSHHAGFCPGKEARTAVWRSFRNGQSQASRRLTSHKCLGMGKLHVEGKRRAAKKAPWRLGKAGADVFNRPEAGVVGSAGALWGDLLHMAPGVF